MSKPKTVSPWLAVALAASSVWTGCAATPSLAAPRDDATALTAATTTDAVQAVLSGEIRAELQRYYADFSARDWPALATHFWPGATITTIWQPPGESAPRVMASTVPEFIAQAPQGPGSKAIFEERMTGAEYRIQGDLAQVWARYTAHFGDPGDIAEWNGIDAFTLLKHDGGWRITSIAFTADR